MNAFSVTVTESERLAFLEATGLVYTESPAALSNLVQLAGEAVNAPIALLAIVDAKSVNFKASFGLVMDPSLSRIGTPCEVIVTARRPLLIDDLHQRESPNYEGTSLQDARSFAGVPIILHERYAVGALCAYSTEPNAYDEETVKLLSRYALSIEAVIAGVGMRKALSAIDINHARPLDLYRFLSHGTELLRNPASGVVSIDQRGTVLWINARAAKLFGYLPEELVGQSINLLMPKDIASHHDETLRTYNPKSLRKGEHGSIIGDGREVVGVDRDGQPVPIHLAVSEVAGIGGQGSEFIGVITDLRKVKETEERLANETLLLGKLHEGLTNVNALLSADGLWAFLHQSLLELTQSDYGWIAEVCPSSEEKCIRFKALWDRNTSNKDRGLIAEILSRDTHISDDNSLIADVLNGKNEVLLDASLTEQQWQQLPLGRPDLQNFVALAISSDDELLGVVALASVNRRLDGDFVRWLAPFLSTCSLLIRLQRHNAEREAVMTEMQRTGEKLEAANRAKTEFLSAMSHELRTPLNSVIGFSKLLMTNPTLSFPDRQRLQLEQIHSSGEHLIKLINEILDLAKIESGRMSFSMEDLEIAGLTEETVKALIPLAESTGVRIRVVKDLEIYARADYTRFKQVLLNLITNAIKYNRPGGWVEVRVMRVGDEQRVEVADSGIGIKPDQLDHIFEPFYRGAAEFSAIEGSGVGLTLTRELLRQMGGRLEVESELGVGSTFSISLQSTSAPTHALETEDSDSSSRPESINPEDNAEIFSILYVEDNPANQRLMLDIFEGHPNIDIRLALNFTEAFSAVESQKPDLFILDINLPAMDGFEIKDALNSKFDCQNVPKIALSANALPSDVERGRKNGFTEYLTKPVDIDGLLEVVGKFVKERG